MSSSRVSSGRSSKTASNAGEGIRLNRFLAENGLGSRRKTEELISSGRVSINGQTVTDLGRRVNPLEDEVKVDGKALGITKDLLYLVLNKPRGYVVSHADEQGRDTIYKLLPVEAANLNYAGRLDKNSEGLLLLTNDGDMINLLTHPNFKVEKVYKVDVTPHLSRAAITQLREGVAIEGGMTLSAGVYVKSEHEGGMTLKVVIREGRKRQIRQMVEAVGGKVKSLKRLQFGPLMLKNLATGAWRPLNPIELKALRYICDKGKKLHEDRPHRPAQKR